LDLPHPLGPTIAVIPAGNSNEVFNANDLKPMMSSFDKYIVSDFMK
jgi:hypothetical protein